MFCPKCGSQIPDGSRFCPVCGADIAEVTGANVVEGGGRTGANAVTEGAGTGADYVAGSGRTGDGDTSRTPGTMPAHQVPTTAYDRLGADYQTPRTVVDDGGRGGHGRGRKILAGIIAVVVILAILYVLGIVFRQSLPKPVQGLFPNIPPITRQAGGDNGGGGNAPVAEGDGDANQNEASGSDANQNANASSGASNDANQNANAGSSSSNDAASASNGSNANANSNASTASDSKYGYLVGTWTGVLKSSATCYGSQTRTPTITVKSVTPQDNATVDIKVNYHAHGYDKNGSEDGDTYMEFKDVQVHISSGSFGYKGNVSSFGTDSELDVNVYSDSSTNPATMTVKVYSRFDGTGYSDEYEMTKA